jgi:hypothetical protein
LKSLKLIDHNIFSIYIKKDSGNSSNIIFGGYDLRGINEGFRNYDDISTIKTINKLSWNVRLKNITFGK